MNSRVFWTLGQASAETGLSIDQVTAALQDLNQYDGKYVVTEIIETVNQTLSAARAAERKARTDYIELKNAILKGDLVETDSMELEVGMIVGTIKTLILGSTLTREQKAELWGRLEECKSVLDTIAAELDPEGTWETK